MTRETPLCKVYYKLEFKAAIRGYHVYPSKQTSELNIKLKFEFDRGIEPVEYDENAIGVYLWGGEGKESGLVEHIQTELAKLLKQFLDAGKKTILRVTVVGKRKREVGLVIPGRYTAMTEKKYMDVLSNKLNKKKKYYKYFELKYEESVNDFFKKVVFGYILMF